MLPLKISSDMYVILAKLHGILYISYLTYLTFCVSYISSVYCIGFPIVNYTGGKSFVDKTYFDKKSNSKKVVGVYVYNLYFLMLGDNYIVRMCVLTDFKSWN